MRRDRGPKGLWEYKDQWIGTEPGRNGFYRYWYDERSGRVKRKALAAVTLEEAQEELVELLGAPAPSSRDPREVYLFAVLKHYQDHYAEPKGYKQMAAIRRASSLVDAAFLSFLGSPKVADLTRLNQRRVWAHMASESGLSAKSIMTYMIAVRAAVNYAAVPQLVTIAEEEVEVQLLDTPIAIFCNQEEIAEHIGGDVSKPRDYIPTYAELGRWIDAIEEEDDFRFVMIMLNTCARNEAIFDLDISKQANHEFGTLDLNPVGRRQTKKRRPVIRMTTNLQAWFQYWGDDKPIRQYQDTVEKRLNKMGKPTVDEEGEVTDIGLGMPEMTCYTLRHFMATNMRRASFPVSKEQRSKWLGHSVNEGSKTTDWYEKFDPDYLEQPMRATEEIIAKLQKHTKRKLFAPKTKAAGKVRVIDGGKL
jgi:integrase